MYTIHFSALCITYIFKIYTLNLTYTHPAGGRVRQLLNRAMKSQAAVNNHQSTLSNPK